MNDLPIHAVLPELKSVLAQNPSAVLEAPPGAGKTTAVPLALLDQPWLEGKKIVMLEPRRLAARNAAARMAYLLGEKVGKTVGYQIRSDRKMGPKTRILVVTEGILTRKLQGDPALEEAALVIFDEFHERNLHGDLSLALALQSQQLLREELKLLVMSATLDGEKVSGLLGGAPVVSSQGRSFPVEVRYLPQENAKPDRQRLIPFLVHKLREVLETHEGNVLVFLPGVREIRGAEQGLLELNIPGLIVAPLYGDLSKEAQDLAIAPPPEGKRKIVLATNIAETSLTIDGVTVVVDAGLQRENAFDPGSGMNRLRTVAISRDAAEQRKGRAGRLAPGVCYRLWHEREQALLPAHATPEILMSDLAPLALELAHWGADDPEELAWMDPPPPPALAHARELLRELEALDEENRITPHGKTLLGLGVHPRLAHMMVRAKELGVGRQGCLLAALLTEKELFRERTSDLSGRLLLAASGCRNAPDAGACANVLRSAKELARRLGSSTEAFDPELTGLLTALAYPDRIGKRRGGSESRFLLSGGKGAWLPEGDDLAREAWLAAADLDGHPTQARIYLAAPLSPETIEERFPAWFREERTLSWNKEAGRVEARERRRLGAIVLEERETKVPAGEEAAKVLLEGLRESGLERLPWGDAALSLRRRTAFLHAHAGKIPEAAELPDLSDGWLESHMEAWLLPHLTGQTSLKELEKLDLHAVLSGLFDWEKLQSVERLAPEKIQVPSGSRIAIDYTDPERPVLPVRLQEMFGQKETPAVGGGRVPLLVHLLSPARRPIQVTADLAGFWAGAYHDVKKELRGRYQKHYWPDDPASAQATTKTKKFM